MSTIDHTDCESISILSKLLTQNIVIYYWDLINPSTEKLFNKMNDLEMSGLVEGYFKNGNIYVMYYKITKKGLSYIGSINIQKA